jgi:hypothetical protein
VSNVMRGVTIAIVQVAMMGGIGAKLLYERATLPRAWIETAGVDPELPIRGRYVALGLLLPAASGNAGKESRACGRIEVRNAHPVAALEPGCESPGGRRGRVWFTRQESPHGVRWRPQEPVAFFLPEHARDPTRNAKPGELWVEATLPNDAAARPIRLGRLRAGRIEPIT